MLRDADLSLDLSKKEAEARLKAAQTRLLDLRLRLGGQIGGRDRAGAVRRVRGQGRGRKRRPIRRLARRSIRELPGRAIAAPTAEEPRNHWLWRFCPAAGARWDRGFRPHWYGRVLVERVENFATSVRVAARLRRDQRLRDLHRGEHLVMFKFWLHISHEEQLRDSRPARDAP